MLGVGRQEQDCRALCSSEGYELVEVLVDDDISAFSGKKRPSYERLLEHVRSKSCDVIVAWHPDRLTRHPRELEDLIDALERARVKVRTVQAGEYDLSTPSGRTVARVVGAVARGESEHKAARIKRKHLELAEAGKVSGGGTRPFGYLADRRTVDPVEAAVVVDMCSRLLSGYPLRSVAAWLNQGTVATVTGVPWTLHVVRRITTSWRICGWRATGGRPVAVGEWAPIVDRTTVEQLRALLLDPGRKAQRPARRYLLTGFAVCGECGAKLVARPRSDKARCYVCATGPGFHGCGKIRRLSEPLEQLVLDAVNQALAGAHFPVPDRTTENRIEEARLADLDTKLAGLAIDLATGQVTRWAFNAASSAIERERRLVLDQLRARRRTTVVADLPADVRTVDFDTKRLVLAELVDRVIVESAVKGSNRFDPTRIHLVWKV